MTNKGLKKREIERKLYQKINSNPDLKYYISDEYVIKLVDLLIEGISEIIEENNKELVKNLLSKR
jgi:predicted house-cleaning noncanonical NTP pyrophosphatase (MazG superfamily)